MFDGYCGTSPKSRKNVRIITELAWQHHFAKNMFIRPETEEEVANFVPDFTVINACKIVNEDYKVMAAAALLISSGAVVEFYELAFELQCLVIDVPFVKMGLHDERRFLISTVWVYVSSP